MKPVSKTYIDDRNSGVPVFHREYDDQIDFRDSLRGKWEVMTIVKPKDESTHTMVRDLWSCGIYHDFDIDCSSIITGRFIRYIFRPYNNSCRSGRRSLLRVLSKLKLKIIWKESHHGYEINSSGKILRKWELTSIKK